jgi:Kef-type K+ transport system membrane component KefB
MSLITSLLLLLISARLLGELLRRVGQPPIIGEILAGFLWGPVILNIIQPTAALSAISEVAVFLIVLSAGLEMDFEKVYSNLKGRGLVVALFAFTLPLVTGLFIGWYYELDLMRTIFLGLCISITALPVTIRILASFNALNTSIARYSVSAAILNDVLALLVLGVILTLPEDRSLPAIMLSVGTTGGKLVLLALVIIAASRGLSRVKALGLAVNRMPEKMSELFGNEAVFGLVILFTLAFGAISDLLGFHFIIGAFFAGLLIDREFFLSARYAELERTMRSITGGFLAPVFFAYLGLEFAFTGMRSIDFVAAVLLGSIFSKIFAGWLSARLVGLSQRDAFGIGVILNGRGVMELVIANIAFQRGFIGQGLFSTLVLMGVVTTVLTPLLFRRVMPATEQRWSGF